MSGALATRRSPLGDAVIAHLQVQIESAQALLAAVLEQGRAIRARDVETVLARMADMQAESERRGRLERDRATLLTHAAGILGIPAHHVTLDALATLLDADTATLARERSAQLRGTLNELQQQHTINRALMKQELAFVEHLTRLLTSGGGVDAETYAPPGGALRSAPLTPRAPALRALDLQA